MRTDFIVGSEESGKGNGVTVEWKETTGNENEDKRMVMASDLYFGRRSHTYHRSVR